MRDLLSDRQLGVLGFGGNEDGDILVGVPPESEEVLVGNARFGCLALQRVSAGQPQVSQCADSFILHQASMIEDLLILTSRFAALI
jgi:hypothetical protein